MGRWGSHCPPCLGDISLAGPGPCQGLPLEVLWWEGVGDKREHVPRVATAWERERGTVGTSRMLIRTPRMLRSDGGN